MRPILHVKDLFHRGIFLGALAVVATGCADEIAAIPDRTACTNISSAEAADLKKAIATSVAAATDVTAFQEFLETNGDALTEAEGELKDKYYLWKNDGWESSSLTTGVTSFIFSDGASLVLQAADGGEGTGHLRGAGFSYYILAKAPAGFPSGDIRLISLGEWSANKRAPVEYFGTGYYSLRFPGGEWEEKEELDLGDQILKLTVSYSLPGIDAKFVKRTAKSEEATDSLEISFNGTRRCAGSEEILSSAFPDVWGMLQLK